MKKSTKGFLIAACCLLVVGLLIFGVAFSLGGATAFQSLHFGPFTVFGFDSTDADDIDYDNSTWPDWLNNITFNTTNSFSSMNYDSNFPVYHGERQDGQAASRADVENLSLSLGAGTFEITASTDDYFHIVTNVSADTSYQYYTKNDTFYLKAFSDENLKLSKNYKLTLQIPSDMNFDDVNIELGAGSMTLQSLAGENLTLECGAGNMILNNISTEEIAIEVGAGSATFTDTQVENATFDLGVGHISFQGTITDELDAQCGMGSLELELNDTYEAHNYIISSTMGNVSIDHMDYTNIDERVINNNASSDYNLECSMGEISISFTK